MKLDVPCKVVDNIDDVIISNIENSFIESDWYDCDYRRKLKNMETVNSLPVFHNEKCYINSERNDIIRGIKKQPLYDKYHPLIEPILEKLKQHYDYRQYAAFFARLAPHSKVGEHIDYGNFLELCHRIHVPIVTNDKVFYKVGDEIFNWKRGEVIEFDNTRMHTSINESDEYRIHLIINLYNLTDEELMY